MPIAILPVIHYLNDEQALRNAKIAFDAGADGIFIIEMAGQNEPLEAIAKRIKLTWPNKKIGVNYLGVSAAVALTRNLEAGLDMTWTDQQLTHTMQTWAPAYESAWILRGAVRPHELFVGVAFKYQAVEPNPGRAAAQASRLGFIPTTSGPATGQPADAKLITELKNALPSEPLALASGVTPENAHEFAPYFSHILVATGVSGDNEYEFDFEKLVRLRGVCDRMTSNNLKG